MPFSRENVGKTSQPRRRPRFGAVLAGALLLCGTASAAPAAKARAPQPKRAAPAQTTPAPEPAPPPAPPPPAAATAPTAADGASRLAIAVAAVEVTGLDEARKAMVTARFHEMGRAIGGVSVVKLDAPGKAAAGANAAATLCNAGRMAAADIVISGKLAVTGDSGQLSVERTIMKDCRSTRLEFAVPRRQESTLLAAVDGALCAVVSDGGDRDACHSPVSFEGDLGGVSVTLGAERFQPVAGAEKLVAVGVQPVRACLGESCSEPGWADAQLRTKTRLGVSQECGAPILYEPGNKPRCETLVLPPVDAEPLRWKPIAVAGAGVVLAAVGAVFALQARGQAADLRAAYEARGLTTNDYATAANIRSNQTLATVLLAGGGAALAGGAAWYVLKF